ncbi:MAG: hypothetical protein K2X38_03290 [Gemmataceae bacterium]|nr:hypothetical protein [Gemmataceae bacterium]
MLAERLGLSARLWAGDVSRLRMAAWLSDKEGADAICRTYPFAGDFDPLDPYWALACVGGRWYVASTANTRFMAGEPLQDDGLRLARPVEIPW